MEAEKEKAKEEAARGADRGQGAGDERIGVLQLELYDAILARHPHACRLVSDAGRRQAEGEAEAHPMTADTDVEGVHD